MTNTLPTFNFIRYDEDNGWNDFDGYFDYLLSNETQLKLPTHFKEFFNPPERYNLSSKITLHDAWLLGFSLNNKFPEHHDTTNLTLELMQAFHEQKIILQYKDVSQYQIIAMSRTRLGQPRDLIWHELTVLDNGFRHLMEFDEDFYIEVIFSDFNFGYVNVK